MTITIAIKFKGSGYDANYLSLHKDEALNLNYNPLLGLNLIRVHFVTKLFKASIKQIS